jgi:hypothetical protein
MPSYFPRQGSFHPLGGVSIDYYIHDTDDSSDPKYYGFVDHRGSWVIMRETTASGEFRYAASDNGYATNWTNRAGLTYGYYNEIT